MEGSLLPLKKKSQKETVSLLPLDIIISTCDPWNSCSHLATSQLMTLMSKSYGVKHSFMGP